MLLQASQERHEFRLPVGIGFSEHVFELRAGGAFGDTECVRRRPGCQFGLGRRKFK